MLLIFQLAAELIADGVAQVRFVLESAQLLEQLVGHLGHFELLDFQDLENRRDSLTAKCIVGGVVAQQGLALARLARSDTGHQLVELLDVAVAETEHGPEANHLFLGAGKLDPVMLERQIAGDVIARNRGAVERHKPAAAGQKVRQRLVHVAVGQLAHGLLDLQALPLGQVELGTHLDVELETQRAFLGNLHRLEIEIRLADRRKLLILVHLRKAVHQELALDLPGDILAKTVLDQLSRGAARPKTGNVRRRHQLGEFLVEVPIDVLARDRNRNVALARAARVDLHLEGKSLRLLFAFLGDVLAGGRIFFGKQGFFFVWHNGARVKCNNKL